MHSHPEVFLGAAVKFAIEPYHRGIFLSDPAETGGEVLFVRLTTFNERRHGDCFVLNSSDYCELDHETVVFYPGANVGLASKFQGIIDGDQLRPIKNLPPSTLKRILEEVQITTELAESHRRIAAKPDHPNCAEI